MIDRFKLMTNAGWINSYATMFEVYSHDIPKLDKEIFRDDICVFCLYTLNNYFTIADTFGEHSPFVTLSRNKFYIGTWECENSPFKFCIYNEEKDSVHDFCLICGNPEERK